MKRLLNLGMSDPLTLGMAHPIADRLETLGRARPTSMLTRTMALGVIGTAAMLTAPITIAADHADNTSEASYKFFSSFNGKKGQSYEIVTEDGEKKAYQILKGGERKEVDLERRRDGSYRLTYADGKTIDLPNIDLDALEGLEGLSALKSLEGLEGLSALQGLEGLSALEGLEGLSSLSGISKIVVSEGDIEESASSENVKIVIDGRTIEVAGDGSGLSDEIRAKIQNTLRDSSKSRLFGKEGSVRTITFSDDEGQILTETISADRFDVFPKSDPLSSAQRQLDRTQRQLEALSDDSDISYDLKNALRDIESARQSLEAAEKRLSADE